MALRDMSLPPSDMQSLDRWGLIVLKFMIVVLLRMKWPLWKNDCCWFGERLFSSFCNGLAVSSADGLLPFNLIYPW